MQYISNFLLWLPALIIAVGASYFRLRGRISLFWVLLAIGLSYQTLVPFWHGATILDTIIKLGSFALLLFLVDIVMENKLGKKP